MVEKVAVTQVSPANHNSTNAPYRCAIGIDPVSLNWSFSHELACV